MGLFTFSDGEHERKSNVAITIAQCEEALIHTLYEFLIQPKTKMNLHYFSFKRENICTNKILKLGQLHSSHTSFAFLNVI